MIIFRNIGEANVQALTIVGVSAKIGENRIGRFGTGFANAVSVLLRYGQEIFLTIGTDRYEFGTMQADIRDKEFRIITIRKNGRKAQQLGFATNYGLNWSLTDAYRELYCNTTDEDGTITEGSGYGLTKGLEGETIIMVKGDAFEQVHKNRDSIILNKEKKNLLFANNEVEIYDGISQGIFYQGIKVSKDNTSYTYNIRSYLELSEDRTIKWSHDAGHIITAAVMEMTDQRMVERIISSKQTYEENHLLFQYTTTKPNDTFKEAVKATRKEGNVSASALACYHKQVTDIAEIYNVITLNENQQKQFDRALTFLKVADLVPHIDKFEIVFVDSLSNSTLGEAFKNKLVINKASFDEGTKMLAGTILEEYLHLQEKFHDFTREMQNYLINCVMTMVEQATGETI